MTEEKKERFYEDVMAIIDLHEPTYMELMEVFFSIILTQEMLLEDEENDSV